VLQTIIEKLSTSSSNFIAEELCKCAVYVAQNQYGCRVIQRHIEHPNVHTEALLAIILSNATDLCRDHFAHYVLETTLEQGQESHKHCIALALQNQLVLNACDKHGSFLLEAAMTYCSLPDRNLISNLSSEQLESIKDHFYGKHVVKVFNNHRKHNP